MAQYSKEQLRSIFQNRFNQEAWKSIVVNIFGAGQIRRVYEKFTSDEDLEEGYFLGSIDTPDNYRIGLFYYNINSGSVAHKKVGFRNLLKKWVNPNWGEFEAAIVVFDDGEEWRLSFICDIKEEATAPKRFTYVFGEHDNFYKTPVDRFEELQKQQPTFENIRKTFSVDALSDDFFEDYRELYADFVQYITGKRYVKSGSKWEEKTITRPNHQFQATFEGNDKLVRDYIKKMFGRIVFLYFLQRKGWLNGNKQYMHDLFYSSDKKDDFLDGVLEPLFFEVLNEEKSNRTKEAKSLPGCDNIPYLNGGLFARDEIDERTCVFPAEYFKRLFDFLDSYNFTIDENDTDDAEIGIDPEMLGRIFENLLEDNKDKGAFYTPKEIVDYMCRESLMAYLVRELPEIKEEKLRLLVEKLETTDLSNKDKLDIRKTLQKVKICDPAIGSGAFPMGLVNLLSKLYVAMKSDTDTAKMKRHIMEQNIYGVDIEKGAVDIARLRFWLAMIVEEKEPIPLPNLHFKIMQGNSLLESYNGIDLSDLTKVNAQKGLWDSENFERENLIEDLRKYYKTSDHTERDRLFNEIINNVQRQLLAKGITLPNGEDPSANTDFFLWHTWFSDVFVNGGFDIVIANPPYGASLDKVTIKIIKKIYNSAKTINGVQKGSLDSYTLFIELEYNILKQDGIFMNIIPISITSSDSSTGIHNILFKFCDDIRISSYAVRPKPVFKNAVVDTSILQFRKTGKMCKSILTTKMHRRKDEMSLSTLLKELSFTQVDKYILYGRIPKIGNKIEHSILNKLFTFPQLKKYINSIGKSIYYRTSGGRYFKVVTNYPTFSTKEKPIILDEKYSDVIGCLLSSSLSFWFYQIYSNNHDWKGYEIENFRIPPLSEDNISFLKSLYERYLTDIEFNANIRKTSGKSSYSMDSFKEYKIVLSKSIIDEIDDYIGPLYGLTPEEIYFIKNYELEFRMSGE